jgi:hypothetical protein
MRYGLYACVYCRIIHQLIGGHVDNIMNVHYGGINTRCFLTLLTEETSPNTDSGSNMPRKKFRTVDNGWYSKCGLENVSKNVHSLNRNILEI